MSNMSMRTMDTMINTPSHRRTRKCAWQAFVAAVPLAFAAATATASSVATSAQSAPWVNAANGLKIPKLISSSAGYSSCSLEIATFLIQSFATIENETATTMALRGLQAPPTNYGSFKGINPWPSDPQTWVYAVTDVFNEWCEFLPQTSGSQNNGLHYIQYFALFYYQNSAAVDLVQGRNPANPSQPMVQFSEFLENFSNTRGQYMDGLASTQYVSQWIADARIEISDYILQSPSDYTSWNQFFTRELALNVPGDPSSGIKTRPVTMPTRDYIVVAPTDCIMNPLEQVLQSDPNLGVLKKKFLENPIDFNTVVDVKNTPISINSLLGSTPDNIKALFVGGTGLSCVLMPNTYHHFHSPVTGAVVHSEIVRDGTFGYDDFPNWVPNDGNVARSGTDFSQFQAYQRGVIIIQVNYLNVDGRSLVGYVASIPVGLDTIGSVVLDAALEGASLTSPVGVQRGVTRLGNFVYGGSLDILLFSKGLVQSAAVQTRLGNQIGLFDVGQSPPVTTARDRSAPSRSRVLLQGLFR